MRVKITSSQMEEIEDLRADYPYTLHRIETGKLRIPWHWHEELEFIYVIQGELRLDTTDRSFVLGENEGVFTNTNTLCSMESSGVCRVDSHLFDAIFLGGHFKSLFETKYLNPVLQNKKIQVVEFRRDVERHRELLRKLRRLGLLQEKENMEFQTRNLLSDIWLLLLEEIRVMEMQGAAPASASRDRLLTMLSYIHEHYAEKLTLEEIARAASVSRRECLRCFQNGIHETPFEYLLSYRVERAKKLLETTDRPVTEIAMETGFSSSSYFSRIFRRECKTTPLRYREQASH